jgi:hypothetical protein
MSALSSTSDRPCPTAGAFLGTFRHGARLLRWRDDKKPEAGTMEQIERRARR